MQQFEYFNSIKVRLEQNDRQRGRVRKVDFNSIKVRLELTAGAGLLGSLLFQFHKGAIRTILNYITDASKEISIP